MKNLRRWAPLVGIVVVAVATLLRAFGQLTAAEALETVGRFVNTDTALAGQVVAAITALVGVVLKVWSIVREIRDDKRTPAGFIR